MGGGSAPCCTGEMGWQTRVELATPGVTAQARTVWVLPPWSARQDTILRPPRCGRGALPLSYRRLVPTPGLEPGHSGVKARYPSSRVRSAWSSSRESNPVSPAYQAGAFTIWPDEDWWTRQVPTLRPPALFRSATGPRWSGSGSNRLPPGLHAGALPGELPDPRSAMRHRTLLSTPRCGRRRRRDGRGSPTSSSR